MKIMLAFLAGVGGLFIYRLVQPKVRMLGYILLLIAGAGHQTKNVACYNCIPHLFLGFL